MKITRKLLLASVAALLFAAPLPAQDATELLTRMKAMEDRIKSLEAEVQTLKSQQTAASAPQPVPQAPTAALPAPMPVAAAPQDTTQFGGAAGAAAKALNPDISVIGDFLGAIGNPGGRPTPSLEMHETEVGFQEVIDPYARADFFITFGEHGVDLEEGYITFTSLPAGLQLKVGKMRAAFGKVNTMHNHVLPWTDRPLVTQNLVGGEDGIDDAGISLSRILPAPKGLFLEGTAQIYRGDSDNVFVARRRSDVSAVGHLRAYADISENSNIDLGGSYARGHSPFAYGLNQLFGVDATVRWKPLRRAIYHSFVGRSEFIWTRTSVAPTVLGDTVFPGIILPQPIALGPATLAKPFGFYVSGDYQLDRRWVVGGRFDRSQRGQCLPTLPDTIPNCQEFPPGFNFTRGYPLVTDTGASALLTYWASEFSQIRAQLRRTSYAGRATNELLFQFQFSMGAHGAHPF
uniref:Phosphate-selective porin O and P n=1 Tax=Solibacter usitatus (strain Ellin6076) TaxID=234267 RepID=Q02AU2_SOLUE